MEFFILSNLSQIGPEWIFLAPQIQTIYFQNVCNAHIIKSIKFKDIYNFMEYSNGWYAYYYVSSPLPPLPCLPPRPRLWPVRFPPGFNVSDGPSPQRYMDASGCMRMRDVCIRDVYIHNMYINSYPIPFIQVGKMIHPFPLHTTRSRGGSTWWARHEVEWGGVNPLWYVDILGFC